MARIGENAFRQYRDGQDRLTAPEYMAERELIRLAVNDLDDKVQRTESIREEFSNTVGEVENVKGEIAQTKQEVETQIGEFTQVIDQTTQELQNKASKEEVSQVSTELENKASKIEVQEVTAVLAEIVRKIDWIDVRDYGAKGDGVADDSQALLDAIAAAKSKGLNTIKIPKGVFLIKTLEKITIDINGFVIKGETYDTSIIRFTQATSGFKFVSPNDRNLYRAQLQDIQIQGNNVVEDLIELTHHTEELIFNNTILKEAKTLIKGTSINLSWFTNCDFTYATTFMKYNTIQSLWTSAINFWEIDTLFDIATKIYFVYIEDSWIEYCNRVLYTRSSVTDVIGFHINDSILLKNKGLNSLFEFEAPMQCKYFKISDSKVTIATDCDYLIKIKSVIPGAGDMSFHIRDSFIEASTGFLTHVIKNDTTSAKFRTKLLMENVDTPMFPIKDDTLIDGQGFVNSSYTGAYSGVGNRGLKFGDTNAYAGRVYYDNTSKRLRVTNESDMGEILLRRMSGNTASRPTNFIVGEPFYDETLQKPIWWNGTVWKDATGATV